MPYATQQQLEKYIRKFLTVQRGNHPRDYTVTTLVLYTIIEKTFGSTAGQFNKTIGDMKKAGIVSTAKGGEIIFLSHDAWEMHVNSHKPVSGEVQS